MTETERANSAKTHQGSPGLCPVRLPPGTYGSHAGRRYATVSFTNSPLGTFADRRSGADNQEVTDNRPNSSALLDPSELRQFSSLRLPLSSGWNLIGWVEDCQFITDGMPIVGEFCHPKIVAARVLAIFSNRSFGIQIEAGIDKQSRLYPGFLELHAKPLEPRRVLRRAGRVAGRLHRYRSLTISTALSLRFSRH
jgi:hypothetical protein